VTNMKRLNPNDHRLWKVLRRALMFLSVATANAESPYFPINVTEGADHILGSLSKLQNTTTFIIRNNDFQRMTATGISLDSHYLGRIRPGETIVIISRPGERRFRTDNQRSFLNCSRDISIYGYPRDTYNFHVSAGGPQCNFELPEIINTQNGSDVPTTATLWLAGFESVAQIDLLLKGSSPTSPAEYAQSIQTSQQNPASLDNQRATAPNNIGVKSGSVEQLTSSKTMPAPSDGSADDVACRNYGVIVGTPAYFDCKARLSESHLEKERRERELQARARQLDIEIKRIETAAAEARQDELRAVNQRKAQCHFESVGQKVSNMQALANTLACESGAATPPHKTPPPQVPPPSLTCRFYGDFMRCR
jgi:hypothetical protein